MGSSAVSVLDAGVPTTCVDNWEQDIQPETGAFDLPDNDQSIFLDNTKQYNNITVYNKDYLEVNIDEKFDLFFYDGPHDEPSVVSAVKHYTKNFADKAILVFDDANWEGVVSGALLGLTNTGFHVKFSRMMLNSVEDPDAWWNGVYILVVENENTETVTS